MPLEGKQIGRYRFLQLLGSGGMGDVYLAEDGRIGQQVAIKVIRSDTTISAHTEAGKEMARLFHREAKAIVKLDHPNILPLYDYGEEQINTMLLIYLVMPIPGNRIGIGLTDFVTGWRRYRRCHVRRVYLSNKQGSWQYITRSIIA